MKGRDYVNNKQVKQLCQWYDKNARNLPWRENKDPYRIWVSEIMLQQTRVEAVKPYFARFMERFPTVEDLANGQEEELLKYWEGLGYYNRIRNMNKAALQVCNEYDGRMPVTYDALITLPGIGPYTAGAIASIAGEEKVPAVDGNVLRVITRLNGDCSNISEPSTVKKIREELFDCMPDAPGKFNITKVPTNAHDAIGFRAFAFGIMDENVILSRHIQRYEIFQEYVHRVYAYIYRNLTSNFNQGITNAAGYMYITAMCVAYHRITGITLFEFDEKESVTGEVPNVDAKYKRMIADGLKKGKELFCSCG